MVTARRRLSKAYNCFMLSLTFADFTMLFFECFFNFTYILEGYVMMTVYIYIDIVFKYNIINMYVYIYKLYRHWRFGTAYCVIDIFLSELTTAICIFTLTLTSYDRLVPIM